jgi:hypothetical protein
VIKLPVCVIVGNNHLREQSLGSHLRPRDMARRPVDVPILKLATHPQCVNPRLHKSFRQFVRRGLLPSPVPTQHVVRVNLNTVPRSSLDPQIEWTEHAEFSGGGTYHGHAVVQAYVSQSYADWAEGRSDPERFIIAGDKIIVFVHAQERFKDSTEWPDRRLADVLDVP